MGKKHDKNTEKNQSKTLTKSQMTEMVKVGAAGIAGVRRVRATKASSAGLARVDGAGPVPKHKQVKKLEKLGFEPVAFVRDNKKIEYSDGYWIASPGGVFDNFKDALAALDSIDVGGMKRINLATTQAFVGSDGHISDIYGRPARISVKRGSRRRFVDLVAVSQNGGRTISRYSVHKVVATAYCGHAVNSGLEVHHIDCDCTNNSAKNLALVTPAEHKAIHEQIDKTVSEQEAAKKSGEGGAGFAAPAPKKKATSKNGGAVVVEARIISKKDNPQAGDSLACGTKKTTDAGGGAKGGKQDAVAAKGGKQNAAGAEGGSKRNDAAAQTSAPPSPTCSNVKDAADKKRPSNMTKLPNGLAASWEAFATDLADFGFDFAIKRHANHLGKVTLRTPPKNELLSAADEMLVALRCALELAPKLETRKGTRAQEILDYIMGMRRIFAKTMLAIAKMGQAEAIGVTELLASEARRPNYAWKQTDHLLQNTIKQIENTNPQLALNPGL